MSAKEREIPVVLGSLLRRPRCREAAGQRTQLQGTDTCPESSNTTGSCRDSPRGHGAGVRPESAVQVCLRRSGAPSTPKLSPPQRSSSAPEEEASGCATPGSADARSAATMMGMALWGWNRPTHARADADGWRSSGPPRGAAVHIATPIEARDLRGGARSTVSLVYVMDRCPESSQKMPPTLSHPIYHGASSASILPVSNTGGQPQKELRHLGRGG